MSYKLGIVGSRVWTKKLGRVWSSKLEGKEKAYVFKKMDDYVDTYGKPSKVISGGASGPDTWGVQWAKARGIETPPPIRPDVRLINRLSGETQRSKNKAFEIAAKKRNIKIINESDRIVAFWNEGKTGGTRHTLENAKLLLGSGEGKVTYFYIGKKWSP